MPSPFTLRADLPDSFYHVLARGINKQPLFLDRRDKDYFLGLFNRYLSEQASLDSRSVPYPHFYGKIEINAFCLMGNHFHMLVHQKDQGQLSAFMRSLMTSYSRYFNLRYKRTGPVFEGRHRTSLITSDAYLTHVTRYIHLNPRTWRTFKYSSLLSYIGEKAMPHWLKPQAILEMFTDKLEYLDFVSDYEAHHQMLQDLKQNLAT